MKKFGERSATSQLLGDVALAREQPDAARRHYMDAFRLDHDNADAVIGLYAVSGKGAQSRAFTDAMESTLEKDSLPVVAVRLMADSYLGQGEQAKAALYYETLLDLDPVYTAPDNPWVAQVFEIMRGFLGTGIEPRAATYFTDAAALGAAYGAPPTVILGPGEAHMAHQTDEYCVIERVETAVAAYEEIAARWCGI